MKVDPRRRAYSVTLAAALLAGCATAPPLEVRTQIPVPCVKTRPAAPALASDAELRVMSDYQLPLALYRDRLAAQGYIGELEAVVEGCSRIPARLPSQP